MNQRGRAASRRYLQTFDRVLVGHGAGLQQQLHRRHVVIGHGKEEGGLPLVVIAAPDPGMEHVVGIVTGVQQDLTGGGACLNHVNVSSEPRVSAGRHTLMQSACPSAAAEWRGLIPLSFTSDMDVTGSSSFKDLNRNKFSVRIIQVQHRFVRTSHLQQFCLTHEMCGFPKYKLYSCS